MRPGAMFKKALHTFHFRVDLLTPAILFFCIAVPAVNVSIGANKQALVDGKPFFPIVAWLQNASSIANEKSYGINTFMGQGDNSTALAYCNQALTNGVYAIPLWDSTQAASAKNNAALLGWVFGDEPDLQSNQIPPSAIARQYAGIRARDSSHIAFLTITTGYYSGDALPAWMGGSDSMYYSYPKYADCIGFDYYPVYGWCRPDWIYKVGGAQDELVNKYGKGVKSSYQWIECCKTSGQWCDIAARGADDGPYDYEVKAETWLAIAKGANAIGYFTHSWSCPGYSQWCINDSLGAMLKSVNGRITALTPVLCSADAAGVAVATKCSDPKGQAATKLKDVNDSLYLIAVNIIELAGSRDTQTVTFTLPGLQSAVTVWGESRTITTNAGSFSDTFSLRNSVHIYAMRKWNASVKPAQIKRRTQASQGCRAICISDRTIGSAHEGLDGHGTIKIYSINGKLESVIGNDDDISVNVENKAYLRPGIHIAVESK